MTTIKNNRRLLLLEQMLDESSAWTSDVLNKDFWDGMEFDKVIQERLLRIARSFYKGLKFDAEIMDIQLTGSMANYNYGLLSDIDVHIIIDFDKVDSNHQLVRDLADAKKWIWNKQHDIFIRGHEVELYVQDYRDEHTSSGLYSLLKGEWVKIPERRDPVTDPKDVELKAKAFKDEVDSLELELEAASGEEKIKEVYSRLATLRSTVMLMRKAAFLMGKDEFSVENLAFKEMRNSGYLEKILDLSTEAYDRLFSEPVLKENLNISDVRNSLKKNDIVKYDGDRYIILDIIDDELWIRPLRNPYGGSYHTSPMSYPNLKVKIDNPKLEFFS